MLIGGLQKTSFIDYPGNIAAVVFTIGCNFRCHYCHNPELVKKTAEQLKDTCLNFLENRLGRLDGVVITGGEPTIHKDLPAFIKKIKDMGFKVKLDTNGTNPDMLEKLIEDKLVDYFAMDIKSTLEKYFAITNTHVTVKDILKSTEIIMNSGVDYEFRTTVVKDLITIDDFHKIGNWLYGAKNYYLQKFVSTKLLNEAFVNAETFSDKEFWQAAKILKSYEIKNVEVRD